MASAVNADFEMNPTARLSPIISANWSAVWVDTRITGGWPAYEAALKANGKKYEAYTYENVNHGFHNDTTPRYDKAAADLAWKRTIDFFDEYLK